MSRPLDDDERQELLAQVGEAHARVSATLSELRRRYAAKAKVVKAAAKAERDLFHLKRELEKLEDEEAPAATSLPELRLGGRAVNVEDLARRRRE